MNLKLELSHTHFRQMRKHLAAVEKAWSEKALVTVKNELDELYVMAEEITEVIKNQLYYKLEESTNGTANHNQGAGHTEG